MRRSIIHKILENHLVSGRFGRGQEIAIQIDQILTHDASGTMVFQEFESLGIERVKTEYSVNYIDHNTLQMGPENSDDIAISGPSQQNMVSYFPKQAMASVTRSTWRDLQYPGKRF